MASLGETRDREEIERRKREVGKTLCCPYCGEPLKKWAVPQTVFTRWPNEYMYVCFNDECWYYVEGWSVMAAQGNPCSYRLMYDPLEDCCQPVAVFSRDHMKDGIIEE